jgi:hypothetical protein
MTLIGILFIALMALLIVYLVFMLNNAIEDARLYREMRNSTKKKKNGIPKIDPLPIPPPPVSNHEKEQRELLRQQIKDGLNPSIKTKLVSESCSMKTFKAVQSYQCPLCEGRGVILDPTGDNAIKCHVCKGEGRVEL